MNKKWIYSFVALMILFVVSTAVVAFQSTNPSNFGHSPSEIDWTQQIQGNINVNGNANVGNTLQAGNANFNTVNAGDFCLNRCLGDWS